MSKILSRAALIEWNALEKKNGSQIGFTCGAFDLLHAGHADYLERAKGMCERLVVAVNTDSSIHAYKSALRPIVSEEHRAFLVASLGCVDAVTLMEEQRPAQLLETLKPDLYIKGGNYNVTDLRSSKLVESYGGRCIVIPIGHQISTTEIIRRIEQTSQYEEPDNGKLASDCGIVFLDRDGTLIENVPYLKDPRKVRLRPNIIDGLRQLQEIGLRLVVVTNQQGIGLGYLDIEDFMRVNSEMLKQLGTGGVRISRIYFCPHSYADHCECRKPGAKLLKQALSYFGQHPDECFMVGDSSADVEAGERAGCRSILVGADHEFRNSWDRVASFADAVRLILCAHIEARAS
jgi:rfaE bifunctional protein nucleotidyltransferase chain/domain